MAEVCFRRTEPHFAMIISIKNNSIATTTVIAVEFSKKMEWVSYSDFNFSTALRWIPVNLFFCGMLFTGMTSLQHNSMSMVTVFKNITNIGIVAGDFYFFDATADF